MVSTPLKKISQNGTLPEIAVKIKNISNHHRKEQTFALLHLCRFGIGEANGDLGATAAMPGDPSSSLERRFPSKITRNGFHKGMFLQKLRATTESCWQSFGDVEINRKETATLSGEEDI